MTKFKSEENKERLEKLTLELGFTSIRLMVDPQATPPSSEAVIEDICLFLEHEKNSKGQPGKIASFRSKQ